MSNDATLCDGCVSELLSDAKALTTFYDQENKRNPRDHYEHGTVPEIALGFMEQRYGVIMVGIQLNRGDIHLHGTEGTILPDGEVISVPQTHSYVLRDFKDPVIAGFASELCGILTTRAKNGNAGLKAIMLGNAAARAGRTQRELKPHIKK
jgi:hypothetical protein